LPTSVPSNRRVRPPSPAPVWTLVILTILVRRFGYVISIVPNHR
jgi:hypothetical protein